MVRKLVLGAAAVLAVCVISAVYCRAPDAPEITAPRNVFDNHMYLNSTVEAEPEPEPEESYAPAYAYGAVLYQPPFISSYFADGGMLGFLREQDDTLTTISGGETGTYPLSETQTCTPEEFCTQFPDVKPLLPEDAVSVTLRAYQTVYIWEITSSGGGTSLWAGDPYVRLFALINLDQALPFAANGALWTYDPNTSAAIPIRFDFDTSVTATSGTLSRNMDGVWSDSLSVKSGGTVYWMPSRDGAPEAGAVLQYSEDSLELRPVMDGQGLYGSKTYGISNNWLGMASSAIHRTMLGVDVETGVLVVSRYEEGGPYAFREMGEPGEITIRGKAIPPKVTDAHAVQ